MAGLGHTIIRNHRWAILSYGDGVFPPLGVSNIPKVKRRFAICCVLCLVVLFYYLLANNRELSPRSLQSKLLPSFFSVSESLSTVRLSN
jgi:hypothetical protein